MTTGVDDFLVQLWQRGPCAGDAARLAERVEQLAAAPPLPPRAAELRAFAVLAALLEGSVLPSLRDVPLVEPGAPPAARALGHSAAAWWALERGDPAHAAAELAAVDAALADADAGPARDHRLV